MPKNKLPLYNGHLYINEEYLMQKKKANNVYVVLSLTSFVIDIHCYITSLLEVFVALDIFLSQERYSTAMQ